MFKEISAKDIKDNLIKAIADEWMLISAGDESAHNMMTASWGFVGEMWGKDCVTVAIRPQRYTLEFVDKSDYFALSFYGDDKAIHKVCGSESGKNVDKTAKTGLTPVFNDGTVYFNEARMVIICKKLYSDFLRPENFMSCDEKQKWYPNADFHKMITAEIVKVLIKE
ncbi:MAG: flavin reductase [Clostridia bacterium]|nr:flavin reductase [Clostridia bacterium]